MIVCFFKLCEDSAVCFEALHRQWHRRSSLYFNTACSTGPPRTNCHTFVLLMVILLQLWQPGIPSESSIQVCIQIISFQAVICSMGGIAGHRIIHGCSAECARAISLWQLPGGASASSNASGASGSSRPAGSHEAPAAVVAGPGASGNPSTAPRPPGAAA